MKPSQLLAAVVALSSVSAAFPDLFQDASPLGEVKHMFVGRQDDKSSASPTASDTPKNSESAKETAKESTAKDSSKESTAKETGKASATASGDNKSGDKTSGSKTSSSPTPTEFDSDVQAGGVNMITPGVYAGSQYYKIGEYVTFAWNYTSLSVTPTAVDIMASCTANQATYTIAVNQSIEATQTIFWNTSNYQTEHPKSPPLLTENYVLMIYDANSSVSATPKPGYLSPYKVLGFGMYQPQPYTSWADFKCANCNGAISVMELLTLKAMVITSATTIASLLYFSASFGVW